ncbi:hypothetical protein MMU07_14335 [Aquiflexum sp. LQ15W]|uniref:hypothetical protein n=1 Tax=Cognataquiflexum nitidum TaxID=2922272 RepID=UPI001F13E27A|nr:hypothetical protein [Cognataquiflexum nitidum]MCH6200760.1 hypothetical protein [Cognataquiflexum nitidum]
MKIGSLAEIKKELAFLDTKELSVLLLDLAKFSTDNKAYLYFKLFERENPRLFVELVQEEIDFEFEKANTRNYHLAKKAAQGIRRKLNKSLKLTKDKEILIELIIYFCEKLKLYGFLEFRHPVIDNLYRVQVGKIEKLISGLHEDLQYDYTEKVQELKLMSK